MTGLFKIRTGGLDSELAAWVQGAPFASFSLPDAAGILDCGVALCRRFRVGSVFFTERACLSATRCSIVIHIFVLLILASWVDRSEKDTEKVTKEKRVIRVVMPTSTVSNHLVRLHSVSNQPLDLRLASSRQ